MPKQTNSGSKTGQRRVIARSKKSPTKTTAHVTLKRHTAEKFPDKIEGARETRLWDVIMHYDNSQTKFDFLKKLIRADPAKNPKTVIKFENQTYREKKIDITGSHKPSNYIVMMYIPDESGKMEQIVLNFKMFEALVDYWSAWDADEVRRLKYFMTQNSRVLERFGDIVNGPKTADELYEAYKKAIQKQQVLESSKRWRLEKRVLDIKKELPHLNQQELNILMAAVHEPRFRTLLESSELSEVDTIIDTLIDSHLEGMTYNKVLWLLRAYRQRDADYHGQGMDISFLSPNEIDFYVNAKVINPKKEQDKVELFRWLSEDPYLGEFITLRTGEEITRLEQLLNSMEIRSQAGHKIVDALGIPVLNNSGQEMIIPASRTWDIAWERFREYYHWQHVHEKEELEHVIDKLPVTEAQKQRIIQSRLSPRPEFDISEEDALRARKAHIQLRRKQSWSDLTQNQKLDARARREIAEQKLEKRISRAQKQEKRLETFVRLAESPKIDTTEVKTKPLQMQRIPIQTLIQKISNSEKVAAGDKRKLIAQALRKPSNKERREALMETIEEYGIKV